MVRSKSNNGFATWWHVYNGPLLILYMAVDRMLRLSAREASHTSISRMSLILAADLIDTCSAVDCFLHLLCICSIV